MQCVKYLFILALFCLALSSQAHALGQAIAFDNRKGNCLACHAIAGGESAGNIGPELKDMQVRYPDKALLRQRIWDNTMFNPRTGMPPFGKHKILSEQEIDLVVDYLYTL